MAPCSAAQRGAGCATLLLIGTVTAGQGMTAAAFLAPPSLGTTTRSKSLALPVRSLAPAAAGAVRTHGAAAAAALALASVALALGRRCSGGRLGRVARQASHKWERKWWSVEETADPTTLPLWQRDYRYGYQLLKRSMVEHRKRGKKIFWKVRVLESEQMGCRVEMLKTGLIGWCPLSQEGKIRLAVGSELDMECLACPQKRVDREPKHSPWPNENRPYKVQPVFSHHTWLEQKASIEEAKKHVAGDIIDGIVHRHIAKGLLMSLDGTQDGPKGMLDMHDISRKKSAHRYVNKMFPPGSKMKLYVVHSDHENGRITLSTKEFEDDDHMGWMLSFPERCFARADTAAAIYHDKREAYINWLQR